MKLTFAKRPSFVPTKRSELGNIFIQFTPCGNNLLTGPILLYIPLAKSISKISPLFVPQYAFLSNGSIQIHKICLFKLPKLTSIYVNFFAL